MVFFSRPTNAGDWNQWRGPGRDGQVTGFQALESWPKELTLQWKVGVGGGHSSPVVAGDQVFVLSRQGDKEVAPARAVRTATRIPQHPENQCPLFFSSPRVNSARAWRPWFSKVRTKLPAAKLLSIGSAGGPSFGSPGRL
jgi:hypothetical protein